MAGSPEILIETQDVLSEVLRTVRLSGSLQFCVVSSGARQTDDKPSLAKQGGRKANVVPFHIVAEGGCWIEIEGKRTVLGTGDVVAFPFGTGHVIGVGKGGPLKSALPPPPPCPHQRGRQSQERWPLVARAPDRDHTHRNAASPDRRGRARVGRLARSPRRSAARPLPGADPRRASARLVRPLVFSRRRRLAQHADRAFRDGARDLPDALRPRLAPLPRQRGARHHLQGPRRHRRGSRIRHRGRLQPCLLPHPWHATPCLAPSCPERPRLPRT